MHRLLVFLLVWLWAATGMAQTADPVDCAQVQFIERAERTVLREGQVLARSEVTRLDRLPAAWRAEDVHIRYRMRLDQCPQRGNWGLWIYRIGGPYSAWVDGQPVQAIEPVATAGLHVYNGRMPALFQLPHDARELVIEIVDMPYVGSGLIRVAVGPQGALLDTRAIDRRVLTGVNDFSSTMIGMAGVLALLVWFMRRQDRGVFWFAAACLTWALRGAAYQSFTYPISPLVMEQFNPWLVLITGCCLAASSLHGFDSATPRRMRAMAALCAVISLAFAATLLLGRGGLAVRALAFASGYVVLTSVLVLLLRRWRQGRRGAGLLAAGLGVLLAGSTHDIGMVVGFVTPDNWSFLTPGFTVLLLCHIVVVSAFQVQQLNRAEQTNEELEHNIHAKSRELEQSYALLRASERASARAQERARFNREIHDGLGAQLITALRGVERGGLNKEQVVQTLQDGLDELRLLMDSSDLGHSLHGALVAWRNRWDARLQAIGMYLNWWVAPDLDRLELGSDATLQIMRVLQEAVTNTVKHAGANHITVRAWIDQDGGNEQLVLDIRDDGQGLPPGAAPTAAGRGLRNMAQRAARLGAQLVVENAPAEQHGTVVQLRLPLPAGDAPPSDLMPLVG